MIADQFDALVTRLSHARDDHGALARLVEPGELTDAPWEVSEQITVRIGSYVRREPWAARARAAGDVAAVRVLVDRAAHRTVTFYVVRAQSVDDARDALASLAGPLRRGVARHRKSVIDQREVDAPAVAGADACWAFEQFFTGTGYRLTLAAAQATNVVIVTAKGRNYTWTWPQLVDLVELQLARAKGAE